MKEHEKINVLLKKAREWEELFLQELNNYGTEKRSSYASVACLLTV